MSECEHKEFDASVTVSRFEDGKGFMADVCITCHECKTPFRFLGLPAGVNLHGASVSIEATEARLAIAPGGLYDGG